MPLWRVDKQQANVLPITTLWSCEKVAKKPKSCPPQHSKISKSDAPIHAMSPFLDCLIGIACSLLTITRQKKGRYWLTNKSSCLTEQQAVWDDEERKGTITIQKERQDDHSIIKCQQRKWTKKIRQMTSVQKWSSSCTYVRMWPVCVCVLCVGKCRNAYQLSVNFWTTGKKGRIGKKKGFLLDQNGLLSTRLKHRLKDWNDVEIVV